uniref:F-box domain-containing protein n=1 Tax=Oryza barthii TaxID=65489 RepID=A0A0D3G9W9_9ORYZ
MRIGARPKKRLGNLMRDSKRTRSAPPREPLEMTEDMTPRSKTRKFVPFGEGAVLPEEMLTEVFLRLPIKSILPNFNSTAVYTCSPSKPIDDLLFTLDDVRGNYVEVAPSPCHGLTLLYDAVAPAYYVFNATTRAITRCDSCHCWRWEFKVVRLFRGKSHEIHSVKYEIFILGGEEGDHWRPTAGGVPFRFCSFALSAIRNAVVNKLQPLINPSFLLKAPRAAIISFSLTDETFRWIRSPPFEVSRVHLAELDDQLCMVRDLRNGLPTGSMFEIWRLNDYNSGDWSLDYRIGLTGNLPRDLLEPRIVKVIGSFGSYRSSKKIIIATSKHKVCAYDPVSRTLETIVSIMETCSAYQNEKSDIRFSSFTKSFTPVHRTRKEIGFSTPLSKATKEILLRLPAESILKLELVCKQWRGLIKNEGFVHAYFEHKNMDRRPKIMLVGKGSEKSVFNFIPLSKWLQEANLGTMFLDKKVVCSKPCHGLNLVSIEMKDYLFNPCTCYRMIYWNRDHQLYQEWSNLSSDRCKD